MQNIPLGHFQLIEVLHINEGFAVALCIDPESGNKLICKTASSTLPSEEQIAGLKREYALVSKAQGDGVVKILGLERGETGCPILLFEHFSGARLTMDDEPLAPLAYLPLMIQLVKVLSHIHSKRIIHRDLNPDNILWDRQKNEVRIIDFNLATDLLSESVRSDAVESLCGTLPYISPEQTGRMNRKVDFRSDYYSLGMTFYRLLAGRLPFQAHDAMGWVYCHITEQPQLLSERYENVPRPVALVIDKLLAKNAEERYQSSYGLLRDLEAIADGLKLNTLPNDFVPGQFDVSERLIIPEKLYGRENELATFLSFFEKVKQKQKFMCIIAGSSGMGKSVLVNEVNKPVIEARGAFIVGKCDQYKRNMPYSAIKPALADLIRQYLAKPSEELESVRQQIKESIGDSIQVIAEVVPELVMITGPLKPVPSLAPNEARSRFQKSFESLIKIFTADGKPLVVFLDDLQWSDLPSLRLIEFLMLEADLSSLMIVAVFRDNEVAPGHPLLACIDEVKKVHEVPAIKLSPLAKNSISALLSDTFFCGTQDTIEFANILFNKTAGNPFHITEMIKTLHESDAIVFDSKLGKWAWTIEKISAAGITNDVVELMLSTLQKCPPAAQERLKIAACVGATFDLNLLAVVSGATRESVLDDIWAPIEKGLIIPLGEAYKLLKSGMSSDKKQFLFKFQHDRVHEAAYLLIKPENRAATHLGIGRHLHQLYQGPQLDNQIIEVVRHYNLASTLLTSSQDRLEACELNVLAATKSRNSVAYDASLQFIKNAKDLLSNNHWQSNYALSYKISCMQSEVAFLLGDSQLVDAANQELLTQVHDSIDRAEVDHMRVQQYFSSGKFNEALDVGLAAINSLGFRLPRKVSKGKLLLTAFKMKKRLKTVDFDKILDGKKLEDRKVQLILRHLVALSPVLFASGDRLASGLNVIENLRLSLDHGISAESAYGFIGSASLFGNTLGILELGNKLGKVALSISERFADLSSRTPVYHVYGSFVAPFNIDLEKLAECSSITIEAGLAAGDLYMLPMAAALYHTVCPMLNLKEMSDKDENYFLHITKASNNLKCHELLLFFHRFRKQLMQADTEMQKLRTNELDSAAAAVFTSERFVIGSFVYEAYNGILHYLIGELRPAYTFLKKSYQYFLAARGTFHETEYHFYNTLVVARIYPQLNKLEQKEARERVKLSMKRMKLLSGHHPHNYLHRYLAMQGEWHRLHERWEEAASCLDKAIESVSSKFFSDIGVLNEIAAKFYLERGKTRLAQVLIQDSFNAFRAFGADAKTERLIEQWPILKPAVAEFKGASIQSSTQRTHQQTQGTNRGLGNQTLDMLSITRASQSLSGQVEMSGLLMHLMKIVVENAGAHYGVLMLRDQESHQTRVVAKTLEGETTLLSNKTLSHSTDVSLAVMLYTSRVNETVIIDDVDKDEKYRSDPYLQKIKPKSVLAMPIKTKGQVMGYFYLENRLLPGNFTKSRVEILNILGTQAAISLENATLYSNLEQKVQERTAQLAEKSRDIRTIMANIKQGIITIRPGLLVHSEYSRYVEAILETADISERSFMKLIFESSNVNADTQNQIQTALDFSILQNILCFEINAGSFIRECTRSRANGEKQILELDWEPIVNTNEFVEKIMVTIRDVTEVRALHEVSEANRKALRMLSEILNAGSERFQNFIHNSRVLLEKARELTANAGPQDQEAIIIAYRQLHTLKGNARSLALSELTSLVHECESALVQMKDNVRQFAEGKAQVLDYMEKLFESLRLYQQVYTEKLLAYNAIGHNTRANRFFDKLKTKIDLWRRSYPEVALEIDELVRSSDMQSLSDVIQSLKSDTKQLAEDLNKAEPEFKIVGGDLAVDSGYASVLTNAFVHLLSNAVNHGLETREQRLAAGKAPNGVISIEVSETEHDTHFQVYDDGRGLNLDKIKKIAVSRGFVQQHDNLSDHDLAMMIFRSGFSTADSVSQSAGRGIGMDALRDLIQEVGGLLELQLDPSSPSQSKAFKVFFCLPKSARATSKEAA